jgi:hypothetical protein
MSTLFDTHAAVQKLKSAGFTEQQAEAQVQVLSEIIESNLATKLDIAEVKRDIEALRLATKADIATLEERLTAKLYQALLVQTVTLAVIFGALKILA